MVGDREERIPNISVQTSTGIKAFCACFVKKKEEKRSSYSMHSLIDSKRKI